MSSPSGLPSAPTHPSALPVLDETDNITNTLSSLKRLQRIIKRALIPDEDFGTVPGVPKAFLWKAGAEKIIRLLGLADTYTILSSHEDPVTNIYSYSVKCTLTYLPTDTIITEGLGACSSTETKFAFTWVFRSQLPEPYASQLARNESIPLRSRTIQTSRGPAQQFAVQTNSTPANTIIKLARKRALVDAALSAARLSNIFTQDPEDEYTNKERDEKA